MSGAFTTWTVMYSISIRVRKAICLLVPLVGNNKVRAIIKSMISEETNTNLENLKTSAQ